MGNYYYLPSTTETKGPGATAANARRWRNRRDVVGGHGKDRGDYVPFLSASPHVFRVLPDEVGFAFAPSLCAYIYIYMYMYVYVCICMYIYLYTCMYIHVCMYVCMYVCMHICICTHPSFAIHFLLSF